MGERITRSAWTHALCDLCYAAIFPGRSATRMNEPIREVCCECAQWTTSGIYYREDPKQMECLGDHSNDF